MIKLFNCNEGNRQVTSGRQRTVAVLACVFTMACVSGSEAATYYVSTSGNDSNSCATAQSTTASSQKRTVAAGVACGFAGDTVYIHGGTYTGDMATIDSQRHTVNSGTSFTNAVTISGVPGETAILQPPYNLGGITLIKGAGYIIIQDLTIDMVNSAAPSMAYGEGIFLYMAHHVRMQRLDLNGNGAGGFGVHYGDDTPFNEILDSKIHGFGTPESTVTEAHGLYITASDNLFDGNEVYDNAGYGFHIYNNRNPHVDPCRNIIRNNRVHNNGRTPYTSYGIVITWGDANLVYNNLIYANKAGVMLYTASTNTVLANNTIYGNTNEALALQYYGAGITVRNNIIFGNGQEVLDYAGGSGTPTLDHNLMTNPSFTNAGGGDFTLQTGSAAVDAGVAVAAVTKDFQATARPQGGGYDIGAFESVGKMALAAPKNLRVP